MGNVANDRTIFVIEFSGLQSILKKSVVRSFDELNPTGLMSSNVFLNVFKDAFDLKLAEKLVDIDAPFDPEHKMTIEKAIENALNTYLNHYGIAENDVCFSSFQSILVDYTKVFELMNRSNRRTLEVPAVLGNDFAPWSKEAQRCSKSTLDSYYQKDSCSVTTTEYFNLVLSCFLLQSLRRDTLFYKTNFGEYFELIRHSICHYNYITSESGPSDHKFIVQYVDYIRGVKLLELVPHEIVVYSMKNKGKIFAPKMALKTTQRNFFRYLVAMLNLIHSFINRSRFFTSRTILTEILQVKVNDQTKKITTKDDEYICDVKIVKGNDMNGLFELK